MTTNFFDTDYSQKHFRVGHIKKYHEKVIAIFENHFSNLGYIEHISSSLVSNEDHSVRFTGSTTNVFKPYILDEKKISKNGFFLAQKCLRTQNAKTFLSDNIFPEWGSYFTEIGTICPYNRLDVLFLETLKFLFKLGIEKERLKIAVSSQDNHFLKCIKQISGLSIDIDSKPLLYYKHKYGARDIRGRNFNFAINYNKNKASRDIGNIILIEKRNNPIAVEMGFGVSTLIAGVFNLTNSIEASVISEVVPFKKGYVSKFSDALSAAIVMLKLNIIPGSRDKERILRTYLEALCYFKKKLHLTFDDIVEYSCEYEEKEFNENTDIADKLERYLKIIDYSSKLAD